MVNKLYCDNCKKKMGKETKIEESILKSGCTRIDLDNDAIQVGNKQFCSNKCHKEFIK